MTPMLFAGDLMAILEFLGKNGLISIIQRLRKDVEHRSDQVRSIRLRLEDILSVDILTELTAQNAQQLETDIRSWWSEETKDKPIDLSVKPDPRPLADRYPDREIVYIWWVSRVDNDDDIIKKLLEELDTIHTWSVRNEPESSVGHRTTSHLFALVPKDIDWGQWPFIKMASPREGIIEKSHDTQSTLDDLDDRFGGNAIAMISWISLKSLEDKAISNNISPPKQAYYDYLVK